MDGHDYHTFQPLLYQVSTGYLVPEEVGAVLRAVFRQQANVHVHVGEATRLDYPARALTLQDDSTLGFDYLIVAAGAETNFFDIAGMREHGWPLYTLPDAVRLRRHLLSTLERAAADPLQRRLTSLLSAAAPLASRRPGRSPRWPANWPSRPSP